MAGVAHLHDVHVVAAVEVGGPPEETGLVDDGGNGRPERLDVAIYAPPLRDLLSPDPGLLPTPLTQRVLEELSSHPCVFGDGIGHALIAPKHVLLSDVVKRYIAVVVFEIVKSPLVPRHEVLEFVAVGTGIAGASFVTIVGICARRNAVCLH